MTDEHVEQPMPTPNDHPSIQSLVRTDLEHREQVGIQRYGTSLQPHNGRDALRDLYEELLDGACYARQVMEERDERRRYPMRYVIGVGEDGVTEIQPVAADAELVADRDRLAAELETARAYLNAQGDEDVPDAHEKLWSMLDWAFWGHGVGDTLRERAAAMMVLALPMDLRAELLKIFAAWKEYRGALPLEPYEELRDRTLAAEKARSELANRLVVAERERDRFAADLTKVATERDKYLYDLRIADVDNQHLRRQLAGQHDDEDADRVGGAYVQGYAGAIARLRDDDRYRNWWTALPERDPAYGVGPARQHLADYLETVGVDDGDACSPPCRSARWDPSSPQHAVIRAAIAWRKVVEDGSPQLAEIQAALITAVDALPDAGEPGADHA